MNFISRAAIIASTLLLLGFTNTNNNAGYTPSTEELKKAGELIFQNEALSKKEFLVHWNDGENFPSLGIGHFIWYPEGYEGPFNESFPGLVNLYKEKEIPLPKLLRMHEKSPWKNQSELLNKKDTADVQELINFLDSTKDIQILYIYKRLQVSLEKMMAASDKPEEVKFQFNRISNSRGGFYPLIDYVNFKGEGIKKTERYDNLGWGLLQVLEGMQGTDIGKKAVEEFSTNAIMILARRVSNSPEEKKEERWIRGWTKRILTYIQPTDDDFEQPQLKSKQ